MNRGVQKILIAFLPLILLSACGGGGGGSGGGSNPVSTSTPPPSLSDATNLVDYVDRFSHFNDSDKATADEYKYNFDDLPDAIVYANGIEPVEANSEYTAFVSPDEPQFTNVYPTPNAREFLDPGPHDWVFNLRSMDLTNGTNTEGQTRAYFGIKDATYRASDGALIVDAAFIQEELVYLDGAPLYRAERSIEGYFCPVAKECEHGIVASFPGEYFLGLMKLTLVETIDKTRPQGNPGDTIVTYNLILRRDDKPTGYVEGGSSK